MNTWSRGVERRIATGAYPAGTLPWKHIQRNVFRLQQRILRQACPERSRRAQDRSIEQCTVVHYSAARRGDVKQVHSLHRFFLAYLFSPCFQASALSCTDSTGSQLAEPWTLEPGSRGFSIRASHSSLPPCVPDMLVVRTGQLTTEDFHLIRFAALSAAPITDSISRRRVSQ